MSSYRTNFTYDRENKPTQLTYVGSGQLNYGYDGIGRIATRTLKVGSYTYGTTYGYVAGSNGGNTTALVASLTQAGENCSYTYTDTGLIASATRSGLTVSYGYDGLGQLIRVNDPSDPRGGTGGTTWTYSYDRGGNILQKDRYPYTTGALGTPDDTISYTYGNAD